MKPYNDEERQILLELPIWLIAGTAQVDKTGPVSFTMELKAGLEFMEAAVEPFASDESESGMKSGMSGMDAEPSTSPEPSPGG